MKYFTYIHIYTFIPPRFIPEGVAEASQLFRDTHILPQLFSYE
jgi:hypothetical protein